MGRLAVLGLMLLASCTRSAVVEVAHEASKGGAAVSEPSAQVPASKTPGVIYCPFHLAAVEEPNGPMLVPSHVSGRTLIRTGHRFLVSTESGLVEEASLVVDPDASSPVVGRPTDMYGHWPDAAWLITWDDDANENHRHAYRWTEGHWALTARWSGLPTSAALFHGGFLVDGVDDGRPFDDAAHVAFFAKDGSAQPLPRSHVLAGISPTHDGVALSSIDGFVFAVANRGKPARLMAERFGEDGTDIVSEVAPREAIAHLWTKAARDVVAFGGSKQANEQPILRHFDGTTWSPLGAPPNVDIIVGYDRNTAGKERVFAYRGDVLSYWERVSGASWEPIALPRLAEGESINGHWITDDDAWLNIFVREGPGRLLRVRPVTHVYRVGQAPAMTPVVPGSDLLPAAPVTAMTGASADPSPFHDAVVGYASGSASMMAPALRLCPFEGRTLVCGVSDTPLVSTADGVVGDADEGDKAGSAERVPSEGRVVESFGAWPDAAWMITATPATIERHAYRHMHDTWVPFANWSAISEAASVDFKGGLVTIGDVRGNGQSLFVVHAGSDKIAPFASRLSAPFLGVARGGSTLFVVGQSGKKLAVEHRVTDASDARVDELLDLGEDSASATVWAKSGSDAVIYGSITGSATRPLLQRFDGSRWSRVALPDAVTRVDLYGRTSSGRERVFAYEGDKPVLLERALATGDAAWRPIVLPTLEKGARVAEVWLESDDAWLLVHPSNMEIDPPRLMRMQPVRKVWSFPRKLHFPLGW